MNPFIKLVIGLGALFFVTFFALVGGVGGALFALAVLGIIIWAFSK